MGGWVGGLTGYMGGWVDRVWYIPSMTSDFLIPYVSTGAKADRATPKGASDLSRCGGVFFMSFPSTVGRRPNDRINERNSCIPRS